MRGWWDERGRKGNIRTLLHAIPQLLPCAPPNFWTSLFKLLRNFCTLHSLDAVDARLSLPSADHPVVGGEEHVLGPPHRHPVHRQLVCAAVPDQPNVTGIFLMFWLPSWCSFLCFWIFWLRQGFLTCLILLSAQQRSPATENG